jgi:serine/threonine-protein kinase
MTTHSTESTVANVTVWRRLTQTRGVAAYLVLCLLTPVVVALTVWQAWRMVSLPDVGLTVDDRVGVEGVDGRWPGVEKHDWVAALDGEPVRDPADWVRRAQAPDRGPLVVTFERGASRWTVRASPTPIRPVDAGAVWARVLTGTALLVMGLAAFLGRPGVTVTWLMLGLAWDLGLFLLMKVALFWDPRLYKQLVTYPFVLGICLGVHLFCFFPARMAFVADSPRRALWLYLPMLGCPVVHALGMETPISFFGTLVAAGAGIAITAILVLQYRQVRAGKSAQARSQYRALLVAFGGGLLVPGVWNWLRMSFGIGAGPWAAHYNAVPVVLFVGMTAYAVARHNALAIDRFTAAVVGYLVTTAVLGGAFAAAVLGIPLLAGKAGMGDSPTMLVAITALTFASFAPVYRRIRRWVDLRFFRGHADAVQMADALRDVVLEMQQSTRDEAIAAAVQAVSLLGSEHVEVWLLDGDAARFVYHRGVGADARAAAPVPVDGPLGIALRSRLTAGVEGLCPNVMDTAAQEELWSKELAMAAPVMLHAVVAGFLGVGRKSSGAGFRPEELSFVSIVAAQLGTALERSHVEGTQLDRYQLARRIGTGGMAEVFLAWQIGPGGFERKVALKRPLPHVSEDPNAVASFLDEARLAAQLQHPNIAQVYDVGESRGTYFIVMEYVDGPSLRHLLRRVAALEERVPLAIGAALVVQVLAALEYAHTVADKHGRTLELVHRDITPRNILLNRRGELKLVDFGIARVEFQIHVTRTGTVKGTLPYMSPEQASGKKVDHRGDLYSAGVVLYELLTGAMAYPEGPSERRPPPLTRLAPAQPEALQPVIDKATAWEPADRYATAAAMSRALVDAVAPLAPATGDELGEWIASYGGEPTDEQSTVTVAASRAAIGDTAATVAYAKKR